MRKATQSICFEKCIGCAKALPYIRQGSGLLLLMTLAKPREAARSRAGVRAVSHRNLQNLQRHTIDHEGVNPLARFGPVPGLRRKAGATSRGGRYRNARKSPSRAQLNPRGQGPRCDPPLNPCVREGRVIFDSQRVDEIEPSVRLVASATAATAVAFAVAVAAILLLK